jgi:hypothetical protein
MLARGDPANSWRFCPYLSGPKCPGLVPFACDAGGGGYCDVEADTAPGQGLDGRVVLVWKLSDRWWEPDRFSDLTYYRLITADNQV